MENNSFVRYNKFDTQREDYIEWINYVNLILSLQHTTRDNTCNAMMNELISEKEMIEVKACDKK